jgi:AcrR family transcriptional regulator
MPQAQSKRKSRTRKRASAPEGALEEHRRRQLVAAVVECISEEGFERTTTRNIADRAGLSVGMLNYYFESKKELVAEAIRHANEGVQTALAESASIPFGPRRIEFIIRRTLKNEYPQALPLAFRLAVTAAAAHDPKLQGEVCRWMEDGREKLERSLRVAIESGAYRPEMDPTLVSVALYGAMTGVAVQAAACPKGLPVDVAVDALLLLLRLFQRIPREGGDVSPEGPADADVISVVESRLFADPQLSTQNAVALASAFKAMYEAFRNPPRPDQDE